MRNKVKEELIRRFNKSTANSGSIVLTMKLDNVSLIITPSWCSSFQHTIEKADMFGVYVDVPEGRAALPYLCASSIDELASNIMNYSGIDFKDPDEDYMYLMNMAEGFVAEYDMYDADMREKIRAMQSPENRSSARETVDDELDDSMLFSYL